jgi:hypothetical protein
VEYIAWRRSPLAGAGGTAVSSAAGMQEHCTPSRCSGCGQCARRDENRPSAAREGVIIRSERARRVLSCALSPARRDLKREREGATSTASASRRGLLHRATMGARYATI